MLLFPDTWQRRLDMLSSITAGRYHAPCPLRLVDLLRSGYGPEDKYPGRNNGRLKTDISKKAEIPVHEKGIIKEKKAGKGLRRVMVGNDGMKKN